MSHPEPSGVRIHDPSADRLDERSVWTVIDWDTGRVRELRLRVARGRLVEACEPLDEREET